MLIRILHGLNAAIFASIGVGFIFSAETLGRKLGIEAISAQGLTDFRATYGGMCLGIGGFFALAALEVVASNAALWAGLTIYLGLGFIRLAGMISDQSANPMLSSFLLIELVLAACCALALSRGSTFLN